MLLPTKAAIGLNPIALRKAKIAYNFGLSECNRVNRGIINTILILVKVGREREGEHFTKREHYVEPEV